MSSHPHHSCPSTVKSCHPVTNDRDVVREVVKVLSSAGGFHHGADQYRCCMVCLMPQSQVSGSFKYPNLCMFTLDRPTCVRNQLSAFEVVQEFSAPACSTYGTYLELFLVG